LVHERSESIQPNIPPHLPYNENTHKHKKFKDPINHSNIQNFEDNPKVQQMQRVLERKQEQIDKLTKKKTHF
jgi:hypothetical protein